MALIFPQTPAVDEVYESNGRKYRWDGNKWKGETGYNGIGPLTIISSVDSPYAASSDERVLVNTSNGAVTVTCPLSGHFSVADISGDADVNNITVDFTNKNLHAEGTTHTTFTHNINNSELYFVDDGTNYRVLG